MAAVAPQLPAPARDREFERLYRRYVKDVYHYALALVHNPCDAEDVTQTTFMNAYRAFKRGEVPVKPQNWLITIAHNDARTRYARMSKRPTEVPLDDRLERLVLPEEDKPDVTGVFAALARLPFNQRAAVVMRELQGRTYADIADTLGVSVSAVETLIFRGRRSLRLKASAVRGLCTVPLPSSLAKLGASGGTIAAGGTVVGPALLLKAAVAIVAGVVATGVGDDRASRAQASPSAQQPARSSGPQLARRGRALVPAPVSRGWVVVARTTRNVAPASRRDHPATVDAGASTPDHTSAPVSTQTAAPPTVTEQVSSTVQTVQQALPTLPSPPPVTLPQPPALPPVDVPLPPVPIPTLP
jgi:RNA polymerase sigma factor (sigma-70 family)